jgi:phage baseplate assembly protein W
MLTIRDLAGNDLVETAPETIYQAIPSGTTPVTISCVVVETDTNLPYQLVSADVDWNDGQAPVHYPATSPTADQPSPLNLTLRRNLGYGTYGIRVTARNNRSVPEQVTVTFLVEISAIHAVAPPQHIIFGPILPRDNGLPNRATWNFDLGSDLLVLESSVRMLLLTTKGERLMVPDYGTNLRRIVFSPNVDGVDSLLSQEITQACNLYEPRVTLQSLHVERLPNERSANVDVSFLSKANGQPFEINLQIA